MPSPSLHKHSKLPLATLAAGLGAMGAAQPASAAIIFFDPGTTTGTPFNPVFVDIMGGQASTSVLGSYNFTLGDAFNKPYKPQLLQGNTGVNNMVALGGGYVAKLNLGDEISSTVNIPVTSSALLAYAKPPGPTAITGWGATAGPGYMGFSIQPAATTLFGWAKLDYDNTTGNISVINWAYEDTGAAITAGTIPEPAETALMASVLAGSAVLFARRRRRQAA